MWEQSLIIRLLTVLVGGVGNSGFAISYCSSSFRFDQLCPDPRFGSREAGTASGGVGAGLSNSASVSHLSTDTYINLNIDNHLHRGRGGVSGGGNGFVYLSPSNGYAGRSYTSSMSIKDPATTSCDFHRNGVETAQVSAIHVTEKPWDFRHASQCSNIVKFNYELFEGRGITGGGVLGGEGGGASSSSSAGSSSSSGGNNGASKISVCQKEIGFRRKGWQDEEQLEQEKIKQTEEASSGHHSYHHHHNQGHLDEEIGRKLNVFFWHNFTFHPHSADFVDTITNYYWSKDDISCVRKKRNAQYVQIVVVVSKGGRCETIVQQYKIDGNRSPWGCSGKGYQIPYPIQFCGSYDCSQSNSILISLKLVPRRDNNIDAGGTGTDQMQQQRNSWNNQGNKKAPSTGHKGGGHSNNPSSEDSSGEGVEYANYEDGVGSTVGPACVTGMSETTTSSHNHQEKHGGGSPSPSDAGGEEDEEETKEPMDWMEALFLMLFPSIGIIFIVASLLFLRSHSAREICRGYSYPRPHEHHHHQQHAKHMYHPGSFTSIDKTTLPI